MIIDTGSAMNFVSLKVIDKLILPIENIHGSVTPSYPYIEDSIWCDVIFMNVTHILLKRPCMFDQEVHMMEMLTLNLCSKDSSSYSCPNKKQYPIKGKRHRTLTSA